MELSVSCFGPYIPGQFRRDNLKKLPLPGIESRLSNLQLITSLIYIIVHSSPTCDEQLSYDKFKKRNLYYSHSPSRLLFGRYPIRNWAGLSFILTECHLSLPRQAP